MFVLDVIDKSGRRLTLTNERWKHILKHPEMQDKFTLRWIEEALKQPTTIKSYDKCIKYYYRHHKARKGQAQYLRVIVKYLNGNGFVITAYFTEKAT